MIRKAAVALALALLLLAPSFDVYPALASRTRSRWVAPGVVHRVIRSRGVPRVVHVVVADVSGPVALKVGLARGNLPGLETTSSMARRHRAIAAINGDFFRPSGRPVAATAQSKQLFQTPLVWAANIAFGQGGRSTFIGHQDVDVQLLSRQDGSARRIARVNHGRPRHRQVRIYTRWGGRVARPPRSACSARLARSGPFTVHAASSEVSANYRVRKIDCRRRRMRLGRGVVVAARRRGSGSTYVRDLKADRNQRLSWSLGWPGVVETLGGNPVLVRDGEIAWHNLRGIHSLLFQRHPRTGVGLRKDGKIILVTVDGRRPRYSKGMTMIGFARLMHSLGAEWALNLDGGGSTTMVVRGKVVNRPSDGHQRSVGSTLMLVRDGGGRSTSTHSVTSDDDQATAEEEQQQASALARISIAAAEEDSASMGGLASWLKSEGRYLPPSLRDVAGRFDRTIRLTRGAR